MQTVIISCSLDDQVASALRALLPQFTQRAPPPIATFDSIEKAGLLPETELVAVVLPDNSERGLGVIRCLRLEFSGPVIAVGQAFEPKAILRALQSGADHYVDQADLEKELESTFARFSQKKGTTTTTGNLLSIVSAAGGSGASTLAVNVSAALAKKHQRCCLVDLHPGRGDLDGLLDLKPQFTLADLCLNQARLDRAMFEKTLTRHPAGIHLLSAPQQLMDTRAVNPEGVNQALNLARKIYTHVVVDLEDCFHDEQVKALQQTTCLFLVFRLEFAGLRNTRRTLDHLDNLGLPRRKICLVANRFGQPNELPQDEVEEALGQRIACFVPNDPKTVNAAHNTGVPVVLKDPSSKYAHSVMELANIETESRSVAAVDGSKVLAFAN